MNYKLFEKGDVSLFLISLFTTVITAVVCNACGAERATTVMSAPIGGAAIIYIIGGLAKLVGLSLVGRELGILGIVTGTAVALAVF